MASFEIAHKLTAISEGGYQCMHDDNGNWTGGVKGKGVLIGTKYGISAPVLSTHLKRTATMQDMKNLSKETAKSIYRANYWLPIKGDEIVWQDSANQIYDMAVNSGVGTAIKIQQRILGLPDTGKMNKATLLKLNNQK